VVILGQCWCCSQVKRQTASVRRVTVPQKYIGLVGFVAPELRSFSFMTHLDLRSGW